MNNEETLVAFCAAGAESVLANELRRLDLTILDTGHGQVRFLSGIRGIYSSLIVLRVADRLLLEVARFPAVNFDALFDNLKNTPFERYIPETMGVHITKVRSNKSKLNAENAIQAQANKAIADRLTAFYKIPRLSEDGLLADIRIHVEKDMVSCMLDISGDPLFKRGYRLSGGAAPLRETTAAAILLLSGWRRKYPLYDPFCGSGTILIEAALFAWDAAPGLGRKFFISSLKIADSEIEKAVRTELLGKVDFSRRIRIAGSDSDSAAVLMAKENLLRAFEIAQGKPVSRPSSEGRRTADGAEGAASDSTDSVVGAASGNAAVKKTVTIKVNSKRPPDRNDKTSAPAHVDLHFPHLPEIKVMDIQGIVPAIGDAGFVITNPPYGKRVGDVAMSEMIYHEIGELARKRFQRHRICIITDHPGFESFYGSTATQIRQITNGNLLTSLYLFNNGGAFGPEKGEH